jgi:hypothetical protein
MILGPDVRSWPSEWREEYKERAAIVEVLGKVPRARAEEQAERIVRERARKASPRPAGATSRAG